MFQKRYLLVALAIAGAAAALQLTRGTATETPTTPPAYPPATRDKDGLIAERYRGIRPAPGYPACPEHVMKAPMFEVLDCADIGMELTESYAMLPASSVSGFYFSHPKSQYFNVGTIGDDQFDDYVSRSGRSEDDVRRTLGSSLG